MAGSSDAEIVQRLGLVPLFSSFSARELKTVARAGLVRGFQAQEKVVSKGEKGIGFYLILDGRFEVRSNGARVALLEPGAFFGEMALFEEQPRTADVVAITPGRCLVLSRFEFWGRMAGEPEVLRALMAELVKRLRTTPKALVE